jgi:AcrR family transcriptional regulator
MPRKSTAVRRKAAPDATPSKVRGSGARSARLREDFRSFARAAILSAAEEVLADEGVHAARIEEIAQRARVAVGTIYNLVGDREALIREILQLRYSDIVALLAKTLQSNMTAPFRDQVHALVLAVFSYFSEHWRFFRLVMESERAGGRGKLMRDNKIQLQVELRKLYRELIQRGVKQGALRADGSELYSAMLSGLMREVMIHDLESQVRASPRARADELTRMFFEGAGTR